VVLVTFALTPVALGAPFETTGCSADEMYFQSFYRQVPLGDDAIDADAADLNGDGLSDIVTASRGGISVLLRRADGSFDPEVAYGALGTVGETVRLGDFNRDGSVDVVYYSVGAGATQICVQLGYGDGSFAPPVGFASDLSTGGGSIGGSRSLAVADLNRDRIPDLIHVSGDFTIHVLWGNGDATFSPGPVINTGRPESLHAADLDADGFTDLLVFGILRDGVTAILARDGGVLEAMPPVELSGAEPGLATGDIDGDGHVDVTAVRRASPGGIVVLLGHGDGTFQAAPGIDSGLPSKACVTGDFNGDGRDDVATLPYNSNLDPASLELHLATADGSLSAARSTPAARTSTWALVLDLNGDGCLDLVSNAARRGLGCYFGNGDGSFGSAHVVPLQIPSFGVLALARFDGDPDLDIVTRGVRSDRLVLRFLPGHGDGTFGEGGSFEISFPEAIALTAADVNGDGRLDLAVNLGRDDHALDILLGDGAGGFGSPLNVEIGMAPSDIEFADFNLDGRLDLAVSNACCTESGARVVFGNGDGTFGAPVYVFHTRNTPSIAAGDLDGDGAPDLVIPEGIGPGGSGNGHTIFLFLNDGHGAFRAAGQYETPIGISDVTIADQDRDGRMDILVKTRSQVSLFLGTGAGGFADRRDFDVGRGISGLFVGDLDGSGSLDVATANYYDGSVSYLRGSAGGSFESAYDFGVGSGPRGLAAGDLNGDGRVDLISMAGMASIHLGLGSPASPPIQATVTLAPPVLNRRSDGGVTTLWIELPEGEDPRSIDVSSIQLDDQASPLPKPVSVGDHDGDGIAELRIQFDRRSLLYLGAGDQEVHLTGSLVSGEKFEGFADVRVIDPGRDHGSLAIRVGMGARVGAVAISTTSAPGVWHTMSVFDVQGRLVWRGYAQAGPSGLRASWNGAQSDGARCASGVYLLRIDAGERHGSAKVALIR
jgi:hypothetical protein